MKKRKLFTIFGLLFAAMLQLAGCAPAEKEVVLIEYDGLSAYEIFCKNYIYIESEEQWIDDLVDGIFCKNYIYIESEEQWIDDLVDGTLQRIDNSVLEEKLIWHGSIEDKFTDDKILLTIDKYFCDKTFTVEDFHMIDVAEAKSLGGGRLSDGSPANQMYTLTLEEPGKVNVIKAIRKLEIFAFTKCAAPNGLDAADS